MATRKKKSGGYIDKFLKRADKALQDGVKRADEALDDAVEFGSMTAKQAAKASKEFRKQAQKESQALQKRGIEKFNQSISSAKGMAASPEDDLVLLEKLGKLKDAGTITEKEFQAKKKRILDRI